VILLQSVAQKDAVVGLLSVLMLFGRLPYWKAFLRIYIKHTRDQRC